MTTKKSFQPDEENVSISSRSSSFLHENNALVAARVLTPERYLNNATPCTTSTIKIVPPPSSSNLVNKSSKAFIEVCKRRKYRKKKRKSIPTHPLSHALYCNEDNTCDADVDESSDSSTCGKLRTTVTTNSTSKTSSMSSKLSSVSTSTRSSGDVEKNLYRQVHGKNSVNTSSYITPPRELIRSSPPHLEFSPLSLSFPSSCTSSISADNEGCDNSLVCNSNDIVVDDQPIKKRIVPETLYFKSFRKRRNAIRTEAKLRNNNIFSTIPRQNPSATRHNTMVLSSNRKKSNCRISAATIMKCGLFIYIYCLFSFFFLLSPKVNQLNANGKVNAMNSFKSTHHAGKEDIRRRFVHMSKDRSSIASFQGSSQTITIKRIFGGFYPIFTANDEVHNFKTKSRRRFQVLDKSKHGSVVSDTEDRSFRNHLPRIFSFSSTEAFSEKHVVREIEIYPTIFSDSTQLYGIRDSGDPALVNMEPLVPDEDSECVPMEKWQKVHHPSCNGIHELSLKFDDAKLIGKNGFSRNAWRVDAHNETIILKTPKFAHNFEQAYYEHDRVDAQAMERLTFSPYVINVYGLCGRAVMSEFADGPRKLGSITDKARKHPLKRLRIARDIALGLSHVHYGNGGENATLVHLDVNPANIVVLDNSLKFNDFNIGIMLKKNTTSGSTCGFPAQFPNPQWRSPEEVNESLDLNEKVDVFSMGHIFFRMICGHEPWNKFEEGGKPSRTILREKVRAGILPRIPEYVMNTKNLEEQVIRDAMLACYTVDRNERPSSKDIAEFLGYHLSKLAKGEKYKLRK